MNPRSALLPSLGHCSVRVRSRPSSWPGTVSSASTRWRGDLTLSSRLTDDAALREAALAEAELLQGIDRGPLHGIPYGVKDIIATAGIPTTWGASPFAEQIFDHDATVVRRLRNAGGVLAAKVATVEIAGGMGYMNPDASFTGPTGNPWNPDTWAGGSSSGPAAVVAAGAVPFAIGSDTSGSIILQRPGRAPRDCARLTAGSAGLER